MSPVVLERLRRYSGPALFVVAFGSFLVLTFPYEVVARRIEVEARRAGNDLTIGRVGSSGLFGLRARDVKLRVPDASGVVEYSFARVDVKPDLLPLLLRRVGFGFSMEAYGGTARGHGTLSNDPQLPGLATLQLEAQNIDVHALPISTQDAELAGKANLKLDLPTLQPVEAASGSVSVKVQGAAIVRALARLEGGMTMTLPTVSLGEIDCSLTIDKGLAKVERISAKGGDVEAEVDGTLMLRPALALSQADLHARVKPSDRWLDSNPMLRGALGFLGPRASDGSYTVSATGPLLRLQPRPGR
jgi:type II secretion system protein N